MFVTTHTKKVYHMSSSLVPASSTYPKTTNTPPIPLSNDGKCLRTPRQSRRNAAKAAAKNSSIGEAALALSKPHPASLSDRKMKKKKSQDLEPLLSRGRDLLISITTGNKAKLSKLNEDLVIASNNDDSYEVSKLRKEISKHQQSYDLYTKILSQNGTSKKDFDIERKFLNEYPEMNEIEKKEIKNSKIKLEEQRLTIARSSYLKTLQDKIDPLKTRYIAMCADLRIDHDEVIKELDDFISLILCAADEQTLTKNYEKAKTYIAEVKKIVEKESNSP